MTVSRTDQIESVVGLALSQAKFFLKEMGEFYPYAAVVDDSDTVRPLGIHTGQEYPDSKSVVDELEKVIQGRIANGDFKVAAICVNVFISNPALGKISAIEVGIFSNNESYKKYYRYIKTGSDYKFEEIEVD